MESILLTIKKMLGIQSDFDGFDTDLIIAINSAFANLYQLGIGPSTAYKIDNIDDKWSAFIGSATKLEGTKSYIYLKTRLIFDPPPNSFLVTAVENQIKELEWRMQVLNETTV